jgi:DnaJ like chaperone protein
MSVWTRIADFAESIGAYLGSSTPPEKSTAFTIGMIALGAKMAKADGIVTDDEVQAFSEVFHVPEKDRAAVERVFNMAKQDIAGFETYAGQVAKLFGPKSSVLESVLDGLFHIAKADGVIHQNELSYLESVAAIFGFDAVDFARIRSHHVVLKDDPYQALGISADMSMDEIKKHYRALVRELHPDKQIAAGVPEEMVKLANDRLSRITAAYAEIEKARAL